MDTADAVIRVAKFFIPFLFSLCFHEYAHGWMAKRKGDRTAEMMGRLNLNPMSHIDWVGTVFLPITSIIFHLPLFGWAQPVPVNSRNLKNPKEDMFWIALAGPLSNIFLFLVGLVFVALLHRFQVLSGIVPVKQQEILSEMLQMFLILNLFLAFFNMLPLHPLDGGKVLARFLPYDANRWLEENQHLLNLILIVCIVMGVLSFLAKPIFFITSLSWALAAGGF